MKTNHPSNETKKKISLALAGHHPDKKTREKMRLAHLGKTHSLATRKKMGLSRTGKKCPWIAEKFSGPGNVNWKGGRYVASNGYVRVLSKSHPRADASGYVSAHILVAEAALGKHLPRGSAIHHVNGNKRNNRPRNLVICESNSYHQLLHSRAKRLERLGAA